MLPELHGPLCQGGTGSPTQPPRGGGPWPRGLHLRLLSLLRGGLPAPALCPQTGLRPAHIPKPPPHCRADPAWPGPAPGAARLRRLSSSARSCHSPGPGEAGAGEPGAEPLCRNGTQTEAWKAGFLEDFLEPGLVGSHTQGCPAPQSRVQTPRRDSETGPASAPDLPVRAQNASFTSGPLHMLFPIHPLVWAAGYHLLQEAFPQAPAQVDGGPFILGCHCPCPALHPNHPEPSPGPA